MNGWLNKYIKSPKKRKSEAKKGEGSKKVSGKGTKAKSRVNVEDAPGTSKRGSVNEHDSEGWKCHVCKEVSVNDDSRV